MAGKDRVVAKTALSIKTKVWIENDENNLHFGKGKTEILERIEQDGSIARAAENMGMSYKKAWSHIKVLQENVEDVLVISRKGRGADSGTVLTPRAREIVRNYRKLQEDVEAYANQRFQELFDK